MHFGLKNQHQSYQLNDQTLILSDKEKDLGVFVDNTLKFHIHASSASKKVNQILGIIKKAYTSREQLTVTLLYKSMVRPHLEYGNIIWGSFYRDDIKKI